MYLLPFIYIAVILSWIHLLLALDKYARWVNRNQQVHRSFPSWYVHELGKILRHELAIRDEPPSR